MNDDFRKLHREWDSPELWPRIARDLERERKRRMLPWLAAAAAVLISIGVSAVYMSRPAAAVDPWMLSEQALRDVEQAEAAYARSIGKLADVAAPALARSEPVVESYREKLKVLDAAIAEVKTQAAANPYHPHLRVQLAALYREKQQSLEEVLRAR